MYKKLLSHSLIYGIAPYLPRIVSVFILPLTTPFLTQKDFGVAGIIISYVSFVSVFYYLSLQVNYTNSFYKFKKQYKWLWRQICGFLYIWGVPYNLLLTLVIYIATPLSEMHNFWITVLLYTLPSLLLGPFSTLAISYYQLNKNPRPIVVRSIFFGILTVVLNLVFIRFMKMGYMGWFWSTGIVSLLNSASWLYPILLKHHFWPIFNFKRYTIYKSLKVSLPLVPHVNALLLLTQSDRVVMNTMNVSTRQIGLYSAAYNLANTVDSVGLGFNQAITPFAYELIREKKENELRNLIFVSQLFFFTIALMFSLVSKEFMEFLIRNDQLNFTYSLMVLISMSMIFKPMYVASTIKYYYHEKTKLFGLYSFIAGIINITLNIIFIPIYGITAAAITTFIGYMFLSFIRFYTKEYKQMNGSNYYPSLWLTASIIICILGYYLSTLSLEIRYSILLFLLLILGIGGFFAYKKIALIKNKLQSL